MNRVTLLLLARITKNPRLTVSSAYYSLTCKVSPFHNNMFLSWQYVNCANCLQTKLSRNKKQKAGNRYRPFALLFFVTFVHGLKIRKILILYHIQKILSSTF